MSDVTRMTLNQDSTLLTGNIALITGDCAGVAVFLASAMSAYVTGVTINVDGGTWASSGWTKDKAGKYRLFSKD